MLEQGRKAGISGFVLLTVAVRAEQTHHINQFVADETKALSEFFAFGELYAAMCDCNSKIEEIYILEKLKNILQNKVKTNGRKTTYNRRESAYR